jgi:hypothetical protein
MQTVSRKEKPEALAGRIIRKKRGYFMPGKLRAIYGAAWSITVLMLLIDWIWTSRIGFQVEPGSVAQSVTVMSGVIAVTALL